LDIDAYHALASVLQKSKAPFPDAQWGRGETGKAGVEKNRFLGNLSPESCTAACDPRTFQNQLKGSTGRGGRVQGGNHAQSPVWETGKRRAHTEVDLMEKRTSQRGEQ